MTAYRDYLDPKYRPDYDDYLARIAAYEASFQDHFSRGGAPSPQGEDGLSDIEARTRYLDADGVSAEVIYAQGAIPFATYPAVAGRERLMDYQADQARLAAGAHAYNRWLADFCATNPDRHIGIARIPILDIGAAVAEVEFAAKAGLRGGVILPPLINPEIPAYNDPRYERLWAACAEHRMTLNMHGGAQLTYGGGAERGALVLAETDWWSHRGLAHLLFAGVFERHPELHLAITEQRTHWAAPLLRDYDSIYEYPGSSNLRRVLPRRPSEYFRSNCFVGASFMSRPECEARDELGVECLMWGSDFPHTEGAWPHTETSLRWTFGCGVSSDDLRAMIGGNAARCYNLDLARLQPLADRIGPTEARLRVPVESLPELPKEGHISWAFRQGGAWH